MTRGLIVRGFEVEVDVSLLQGSSIRGSEDPGIRGSEGQSVRGSEGPSSAAGLWRFAPLRSLPVFPRAAMCRRAAYACSCCRRGSKGKVTPCAFTIRLPAL